PVPVPRNQLGAGEQGAVARAGGRDRAGGDIEEHALLHHEFRPIGDGDFVGDVDLAGDDVRRVGGGEPGAVRPGARAGAAGDFDYRVTARLAVAAGTVELRQVADVDTECDGVVAEGIVGEVGK